MLRDRVSEGWLLPEIQNETPHVISSLYCYETRFDPPPTDDLIDGFLSQLDIRQFQLTRAIVSVVQDRRTGCLILLNRRTCPTGFYCDKLRSQFLEPLGAHVGDVASGDINLCCEYGESREGRVHGADH